MFTLLRSEGGVRQVERLGSLVNSVCNNVLLEYYRSSTRADPLLEEEAANLLDRGSDALSDVISKQTREQVHEVLGKLSQRDRNVLRSVFVEERDKDEVCRELGVDRQYMRVLLHRAKNAFRVQYEQGFGAGATRR